MKHVFLTVVLVMAMVGTVYAHHDSTDHVVLAQEDVQEMEVFTYKVDVLQIGAGTDTINIQISDKDGAFQRLWVVLEGEMAEEQMATVFTAVALEQQLIVELVVPRVAEGKYQILKDFTPVNGIFMELPQKDKTRIDRAYTK